MAKRQGKLKDIHIKEVSLVDLPANKLPFLFFKREDGQQADPLSKQKKVKIGIESDGTVGGTKITVNGDKLGKLRSFDFSFYGADPKATIHASYSKETGDKDGFTRTETYYLSKGEIMDAKTLKALQKYLGTEDIDFEKKVAEEDVAEALTLIAKEYKDSFPEDLENAVGVIAKCAASRCEVEKDDKDDVEKAGAKFNKDTLKKLQAVLAAMEALKSILPDMAGATKKSDSSDVSDELAEQITQLSEAVAKLDTSKKDNGKSGVAELTKTLEEISERLKTVEDGGATKKSITGDDENDDEPKGAGEDGKPLWPTVTGQGKS